MFRRSKVLVYEEHVHTRVTSSSISSASGMYISTCYMVNKYDKETVQIVNLCYICVSHFPLKQHFSILVFL